MNVLFVTLVAIDSIEDRGIYQDLLRQFRDHGHTVTVVTPVERRRKISTNCQIRDGVSILQVRTFNITQSSMIEKGIGTMAIEYQYLSAIKKHLIGNKFDLVLYSTPPITFAKVIKYIKKRDRAYSYLLLKDIFPQNAVDMKMIRRGGLLHRLFEKKEKELYRISDTIGCMSPANVDFILKHHPEVEATKVEVNPNSIEPIEINYSPSELTVIRQKYGLPLDKVIFVYGGNLGRPQGLDFLLEVVESTTNDQAYFLIVGDGTEFLKIKKWFETIQPVNAKLLQRLPKKDYDTLLASCDVGLIFLDRNFTIPNFPSRLLSYLEMKKPVIAATDPHTDIGTIVQEAGCGFKVLSGDFSAMQKAIDRLTSGKDRTDFGLRSWQLLQQKYHVEHSYELIVKPRQVFSS